jgi:hypothetical protein
MRQLLWTLVVLLVAEATAVAQSAETKTSSVGYPSVASALADVRSKNGVRISNQNGWTVIEDGSTMSLWSFTPAGHPAHPAVVRRTVSEKEGAIFVEMAALCEAMKPACDKLVAEFQELTNKMRECIRTQRGR